LKDVLRQARQKGMKHEDAKGRVHRLTARVTSIEDETTYMVSLDVVYTEL